MYENGAQPSSVELMSALGHKRTFALQKGHVRFTPPKANVKPNSGRLTTRAEFQRVYSKTCCARLCGPAPGGDGN